MKSATKKRNELLSLQSGGDHLSPQDHNSLECRSSGLSWPSDGESKQKELTDSRRRVLATLPSKQSGQVRVISRVLILTSMA